MVWLGSGEGVINGTMSLSAPALERILQAVNEKYGTSFEGWSQKPTVYEVGDTVPNWNAYEKIMLPIVTEVKFKSSSVYYIGRIEQTKLYIYGDGDTKFAVIDPTGYYRALGNDVEGLFNQTLKPALVREGYDVNSYEDIILDLPLNSEVPNFADMVEISL